MTWDGSERRKIDRDDHDVLTRIDVNLSNFMKQFEEHTKQDESSFEEVRRGIDLLKRYVYLGVGGILALELIYKVMK